MMSMFDGPNPMPGQRTHARCRGVVVGLIFLLGLTAPATILWNDLGATLVHENGVGVDILEGAVRRNDLSTDTLYFKFHVDPLSDKSTEEYFAAFELYEGDAERLAVGNSLKAWAYSAFNTAEKGQKNKVAGDVDLRSAKPESLAPTAFEPYELPRRGIECTLVIKVDYVADGYDRITVWLNPDLAPGATEAGQAEPLTTRFRADASFDQIRLRHGGGGGGWTFSEMAIATDFRDFVATSTWLPAEDSAGAGPGLLPLTIRPWQREQGLPQNSVRALAQTQDGYLWIGLDDGAARFDGIRFVSFGLREGLRSGPIQAILEDRQGGLWFGTDGGGLSLWQSGRFTTFTRQDGLPADSVTALAEDPEGHLWVGTQSGLVKRENGRFVDPGASGIFNGKTIAFLTCDRQNRLWVGVARLGVFALQGGIWTPVTESTIDSLLQDPHCLLVDSAGRLWIGAGDDFVLCREAGGWRRYRIPRHLARPYVTALAEEPDGTIWASSSSEGLFQFREGKVTPVNANSGLLDNSVQSLLVDREGNLWAGTATGLNRLRRSNLTVLGPAEGLGYGAVQGLAEVAPGVVWVGKPSDGLYRWSGGTFGRLLTSELSRRFPDINTLLMAQDGTCWVGSAQGLLRFRNPTAATLEMDAPALSGLNVTALAEGANGEIWAAARSAGLWRFQDRAWTAQTNYPVSHPITAILSDGAGKLWLGTEGGGLFQFGHAGPAHFDHRNGLVGERIRCLYLDAGRSLWVGTAGGGLSRWREGQMASLTAREGLPDDTISQILEDDARRLWLAGGRGLACIAKQHVEDLFAGRVSSVYPQVYGRAEGMPSEECTGGFSPAGLKTRSGLLWFPTLKGIVVANPRLRLVGARTPRVLIEETLVDGLPVTPVVAPLDHRRRPASAPAGRSDAAADPAGVPASGESELRSIRIPPGKHRLDFRFTGLNLSAPERIQFRCRLESWEPDWVKIGTQRSVSYGYVPPGEYLFRVTACDSDGVWNETGAVLAATVLPHFWQAWWFMGLAAAGLVTLVGGSARLVEKRRMQHRVRRLEQERALERERTRISQDLHDDLGASLTRISLLSDLVKADKDAPRQVEIHAGKISVSAAQTVRALEEIVWALRPGSDSLQSLVEYIAHFANELFEGDTARCRLDLPPDLPARMLPPDMRHNIFLVVKEALTNALKHAGAREVRVQAKVAGPSLEITIQDDGCGFSLAEPPHPGKQHGLGNMRDRAQAMGGKLELESLVGGGTIVRLSVPLPEAAHGGHSPG